MKTWSKSNLPQFNQRKQLLRSQIEAFCSAFEDVEKPHMLDLQNNLASLLLQEDIYWKQRSKIFWLKEGDTNNKFFHAATSTRRRKNTIT